MKIFFVVLKFAWTFCCSWFSCVTKRRNLRPSEARRRKPVNTPLARVFDCELRWRSLVIWATVWFGQKWERVTLGSRSGDGGERTVGGRYGVTRVSFSCCRLEADVGGITPPVSSLTQQPHLHPYVHTHTHTRGGEVEFHRVSNKKPQWLMWCCS